MTIDQYWLRSSKCTIFLLSVASIHTGYITHYFTKFGNVDKYILTWTPLNSLSTNQ